MNCVSWWELLAPSTRGLEFGLKSCGCGCGCGWNCERVGSKGENREKKRVLGSSEDTICLVSFFLLSFLKGVVLEALAASYNISAIFLRNSAYFRTFYSLSIEWWLWTALFLLGGFLCKFVVLSSWDRWCWECRARALRGCSWTNIGII